MPLVYVEGDDPSTWGDPIRLDASVGAAALGTNRAMWGSAENETFAAIMARMMRRAKALQRCERLGYGRADGPICGVMGSFASDVDEAEAAAGHGLLTADELAVAREFGAWFSELVCPGPYATIVLVEPHDERAFTPRTAEAAARRAEQDKSSAHVMVEAKWLPETAARFAAFIELAPKLDGSAERLRCGLEHAGASDSP